MGLILCGGGIKFYRYDVTRRQDSLTGKESLQVKCLSSNWWWGVRDFKVGEGVILGMPVVWWYGGEIPRIE